MRARRTASAKIRRADAVTRTDIVSCVTCELRDRCRDPRKSKMFACAAWLEQVDKNDDPSTRDFARSMRELVQRESVVPDPYAIDDRDSPAAPNSYAWACGEQFLNYQPSPYPKQLELCINLFSDKCSYCRGSWYEDIPHDCDIAEIPRRIMLRQFGRCPRCHRTRLDGIRDGREKDYNGLLAVVGQRGGKSASLSIIDSYQMHMLLKIKNPSAFYGIKTGTVLYNTIVGTTYGGAKSNVYDPLLASVQESPWFNSYGELLRDVAQKRGMDPDDLYRIKDSFIHWRTAGLMFAPASPSRRNLRGKTRIGFVVDELGHFGENEKQVNISGKEVWRALTRSLFTVRPQIMRLRRAGTVHVPPAIAVGISSPYSISDPITQLYNQFSKLQDSTTYCVKLPTWKFNPSITFASLTEEFALDPVSAWRDFGCRPPFSANAFVGRLSDFRRSVNFGRYPYATQQTRRIQLKTGGSVMTVALKWRRLDPDTPRIMAMDAGRTLNSFALAIAHLDTNHRVCYDLFVEIQPRPNMPVSFNLARSVMKEIVHNMGVVVAVSDRWQNYSINDMLREQLGVTVLERRLTYGDFTSWRDDLVSGKMEIPRPELPPSGLSRATSSEATWLMDKPTSTLLRQGIIVVDEPGKTVSKPTEGNDDVFRCAVLVHAASGMPEMREMLKPSDPASQLVGAIGVSQTTTRGVVQLANKLPETSTTETIVVGNRPTGVMQGRWCHGQAHDGWMVNHVVWLQG